MLHAHNVVDIHASCGARRLIYASSCHTQHGKSMKTSFETLKDKEYGRHLPGGKLHKLDDVAWPSSFYGAGKLLGESIARMHAIQESAYRLRGLHRVLLWATAVMVVLLNPACRGAHVFHPHRLAY